MFEFWYLFPAGVLIAVCAMSSGISGSSFWTPVYLLGMRLEPKMAFWVALLTMLFGFGSGVTRNVRDGTLQPELVRRYLWILAPATVAGAIVAARVGASWLLAGFAIFVLGYGIYLVREFLQGEPDAAKRRPHEKIFYSLGALAGLLQGSIASGAGVLLMPALLDHKKVRHHSEAVGSTVVLVFAASLISVLFRVDGRLFATLVERSGDIVAMVIFAAPGVVVGGQLGPRLAQWLPRRFLRLWVGLLLVVVGLLVGARAI